MRASVTSRTRKIDSFCLNWSQFDNGLRVAGWSFSRIAVNLAYDRSVTLRYCSQNLNHHLYTCRPGSICQRCTDECQDLFMFKAAVIYRTVSTVYQNYVFMCANANHLKILTSSKITRITQLSLVHQRRRSSLRWSCGRLEYCSVILSDDNRFIISVWHTCGATFWKGYSPTTQRSNTCHQNARHAKNHHRWTITAG